jgi:hypothetical protein
MTDAGSSPLPSDDARARAMLVMLMGVAQTAALCSAARLDLADHLRDGPRSLDALAAVTEADPVGLARLLDALIELQLLTEEGPGQYACTPIGELLRSDGPHSLKSTAMLLGHEALVRTWPMLTDSVRTGSSSFEKLFGTDAYTYAQQNPELLGVFQTAMGDQSRQEAAAMLRAYDFTGVGTVVDVGGGRGALLAVLLSSFPRLAGVLLELPPVVAAAAATFDTDALRGRCQLVAGDFSVDVPEGGDLYVVKRVLMDRTDDQAHVLLGNVRRAIVPGGRLLVAEPATNSHYGSLYDLMMLVVFGTRLRPEAQMRALLAETGFALTRRIDTNAATGLCLYEASPESSADGF